MSEFLPAFLQSVWTTAGQMAPWLLVGFLAAGILHAFIPERLVRRHLGGSGLLPVLKASLAGVPLPLCSCGVIPVAAQMRRSGASRASCVSFLISTPQTGVDSIAVTWSLLGPVFALFRPAVAFASGVVGGLLVSRAVAETPPAGDAGTGEEAPEERGSPLARALRHAFVTLPADLSRSLVAGILIAGAIGALLPPDALAGRLGQGILPMLAMMALGIPLYVCATGSVPIAAALVARGLSPGAALVFLVTGPATNAAAIAIVHRTMGRATAAIYVATVAATGLASGLLLDTLFTLPGIPAPHCDAGCALAPWESGSALLLAALLLFPLLRRGGTDGCADPACRCGAREGEGTGTPEAGGAGATPRTETYAVRGMRCSHCANAVTRALSSLAGVVSVEVDLAAASARVTGPADPAACRATIRELGYGTDGE